MAIEEINETNGVKHTRETTRERRYDDGRFVPPSALASIAADLMTGRKQSEVAKEMGTSQARISQGVNGKSQAAAIEIIEHYAEEQIEGPYYYIPDAIDEAADQARWSEMEHPAAQIKDGATSLGDSAYRYHSVKWSGIPEVGDELDAEKGDLLNREPATLRVTDIYVRSVRDDDMPSLSGTYNPGTGKEAAKRVWVRFDSDDGPLYVEMWASNMQR